MSLDKIKNTIIFGANQDTTTKNLELVIEVKSNTDVSSIETANTDSINSYTIIDQEYSIDADFIKYDIPTNERVNPDELNKIKFASVYTTGITEDQKIKTLDLVSEIYDDVTADIVLPDLSRYGFTDFKIKSGTSETTGFDRLNFTEKSGFSVERDEIDVSTLNINHNSFNKIVANNKELSAEFADTIFLVGDGIEFETTEDEFNRKYLTIINTHKTLSSLDDVALDTPLNENDILIQQDGKFKNKPSQDVRPSIVYGGEF